MGTDGLNSRVRRELIALAGIVLALAVFSAVLVAPTASATQGGPDQFGYCWVDSNPPPPQVPFNWIEIQDNGTLLWGPGSPDDDYANLLLGFSFSYYGTAYSDVYVGTNGYLSFGQGYADYILPPIPDPAPPNNAIYPFGADLFPGTADPPRGGVYYKQLTSPNRFVVEWYQVPHVIDSHPVTFQAILDESGDIWFQYLTVGGAVSVVGIEDSAGTDALNYGDVVADGVAVRFSAAAPSGPVAVDVSPCSQVHVVSPGDQVDAPFTVTNAGTGTETIDMTYNSLGGWSATFYEGGGLTLLADTDGDMVPDTGALGPGAAVDLILRVDACVPLEAPEMIDVVGTSSADRSVFDSGLTYFIPPTTGLLPPYSDFGDELDMDGQYDLLVVEANVTVAEAGTYSLSGTLHDPDRTFYVGTGGYVSLEPGVWTFSLTFDGRWIYGSGVDGPYLVDLRLYGPPYGNQIDNDTHTTAAYSHLDFETTTAGFEAPHSHAAIDTDMDGLYDQLTIEVSFTVNVAGLYEIDMFLSNASMGPITDGGMPIYDFRHWSVGPHTVSLSFPGSWISGSGFGGPFLVYFTLWDWRAFPYMVARGGHLTDLYDSTDFNRPLSIDALFTPETPTIDGSIDDMEWSDADVADLSAISGNSLSGYMLVMATYDTLYVAYDVVGDTTMDSSDAASISFDTGNDARPSDAGEDQFVQGGWVPNNQAHIVFYAWWWWDIEDSPYNTTYPDHAGLASAWGFGASPRSTTDHRMYEFAIPYALIGASRWDVLGLYGGSYYAQGIYDGSTGSASYWPEAYDILPLMGFGNLLLTPGTKPPTLAITAPASGALFPTDSVTVGWTVSDVGTGIDHFEVSLDGSAPHILPATATSYTLSGLRDGSHVVSVTAFDWAGNSQGDAVSFTVDTIEPTIAVITPSPGYLATRKVTVSWTAADSGSGLDRIEIILDGAPPILLPDTATTYTLCGLSDGPHTIEVRAVDLAGNAASSKVSVTVDALPPSLTISAPAQGAILNSDTVQLIWSASDATSGVEWIKIVIIVIDGGAPIVLAGGTSTYSAMSLADGPHTFQITVFDLAGNQATDSRAVIVDTTDPSVSIYSPDDGSVATSSSTTARWTASDATSGVDHVELRVDGGAPQTLSATATSHALSLGDGTHTVTITVVDRAGNAATESVTFRVDTGLSSPSGPYGYLGTVAVLVVVAIAVVLAVLILRRRRGTPPGQT